MMRAKLAGRWLMVWRAAAMRIGLLCLGAVALGGAFVPHARADAFSVTQFSPWHGYAIPNGLWLTGDFFGARRNGIVHVVNNSDYVNVWNSRGDGTFDVRSFRPWAGYAMPNGVWVTADLTGDGRTDIVHVVQGADYVNVWRSKGDGTFDVKPFRPWAGYAMPNGVWLTADLNGDGETDLVHVVQGADYVNVWRSKGDGTFEVKPFRPWPGYAMPNGVWLAADLNGDGKTDLVHVVQGADYVNVWRSKGDGTFDVKPFRPWAGYAMPNGVWLAGKFTGSRNTDLVHIVQGADYANVWRSKGDGTFEVKAFRPWPGYAMPNGVWLAGDFDRDGKADLVHAVQGADYVNIWRSRGDMTFNVTSFSPWRGYAIPNGVWLAEDWSGDGKMDIVHAVQGTDYVHPWRSTLPAPGEFSVEALEVTQSIQDMAHSVPLVADKGTVVRAYLDYNGGTSSAPVSGTLLAFRLPVGGVQSVAAIAPVAVNPAQNGQLSTKRNDAALSLNFRLPPASVASGTVLFAPQTLTSGGAGAPCADCGTSSRVVGFSASGPVRVHVIGLSYTTGTPPTTYAPRALDFDLIRSWLGRAYPTASVQMTSITVPANPAWPFDCNAANTQLAAIRGQDVGTGTDARTHYFGLVADGAGFMRGCAAGIPTTPNPATVASGPTGSGNWGWDNDGSYGDWYTGHELGHTYGRFHIGSGCGESSDDPNYPFPKGQLSKDDDAFVGFDLGDAAHGIAMAAYPGPQWHDVMSYCVTQWLSSYTYEMIRTRLIAENGLAAHGATPSGGPAIAPMVGPTVPEPALPAPGAVTPTVAAPDREPVAGSAPEQVVTGRDSPAPVRYGVSEASVAALRGAGVGASGTGASTPASEVSALLLHTLIASDAASVQPATPNPPPQGTTLGVEVRQGPFLHVVATVNLTRGTGHITNINQVQQAVVPLSVDTSRAQLRIIGANGADLGERPVEVKLDSELRPNDEQVGIVDVAVTVPAGTEAVALLLDGKVVDQAQGGSGAAGTALEALRAPRPTGHEVSASRQDGQLVIQWQLVAPGLTYNVQVSTDSGATWQTVGTNVPGNRLALDAVQFAAAGSVDVRVSATTGFQTQMLGQQRVDLRGQ